MRCDVMSCHAVRVKCDVLVLGVKVGVVGRKGVGYSGMLLIPFERLQKV